MTKFQSILFFSESGFGIFKKCFFCHCIRKNFIRSVCPVTFFFAVDDYPEKCPSCCVEFGKTSKTDSNLVCSVVGFICAIYPKFRFRIKSLCILSMRKIFCQSISLSTINPSNLVLTNDAPCKRDSPDAAKHTLPRSY